MSTEAGRAVDRRVERDLDPKESTRLRRLAVGERVSLVVSNALFLVVAVALAVSIPSDRAPSALAVVLLIAAYAAAFEFDFKIGTGSAVPTQLVLVPMLFVLPTGTVPLAVAAAIVVASAYDALRGSLHVERVFLRLAGAWHAVGPALVLGLVGEQPPALSDWPIYLAALAAQFAIVALVASAREWVVLGVAPTAHVMAAGRVYVIDVALAAVGLAIVIADARSSTALVVGLPVITLLALFLRERHGRLDNELELRDAYRRAESLLGDDAEAQRREVDLTLAVADELGLSGRDRRDAEFAGLLHDVGKASIPTEIIHKPGPLTPEERAVVQRHTLEGEVILHRVGGLVGRVGRIVRSCQERYDGTGYPDGTAGERIPLVARLIACCDAFSAMTSDRPYRKALSVEDALEELRRNRGTQFDPRVVDALIAVVERSGS